MRVLATIIFTILAATSVSAASFDCEKARSVPEILICGTPHLSQADEDLFSVYKAAKRRIADWKEVYPNGSGWPDNGLSPAQWFKSSGRDAWRWREKHCRDVPCLEKWFAQRRAILKWIATADDHLGDYGLQQLVTLPDQKVLLSYGMVTHRRNVVFDPATDRFIPILNGHVHLTGSRNAPILLRQSKGYFKGGGAFWVDIKISSSGRIFEIGSANGNECFSREEFLAGTSFQVSELQHIRNNRICVER